MLKLEDDPTTPYRQPWQPEPIARMRLRYKAAVAPFPDGDEPNPFGLMRHIFDFADGLRLVVGITDVEPFGRVLYIRASTWTDSHLNRRIQLDIDTYGREAAIAHHEAAAIARFRHLSDDNQVLTFIGHDEDNDCPHWIRPLTNEEERTLCV